MAQFNSLLVTGDSRFLNPINGNARNGVYTVVGTQTAATGSWTGVIPVPALYDGLKIAYYLPYAGSGNATLNLTLSNGTTTGAINCYYRGNSRLTTHYGAGDTVMLTYFSAGSISVSGTATTDNRWIAGQNYTDGNDGAYYDRFQNNKIKAGSNKIFPYTIICQLPDGRWESIVTSSSIGTSKSKNTHGFLFGQIALMYANATYNENVEVGNNYFWTRYGSVIDHRYSFNTANDSTNGTTAIKPVYLVGTISSDGLYYLDTKWWTQTLPSTADGKIYTYIGDAYDYYRMTFTGHGKSFVYTNGHLREFSQDAGTVNGLTVQTAVPANAEFTDHEVMQFLSSEDGNYPILMSYADKSSTTEDVTKICYRNNSVYINPSSGVIVASGMATRNSSDNNRVLSYVSSNDEGIISTYGSNNNMTATFGGNAGVIGLYDSAGNIRTHIGSSSGNAFLRLYDSTGATKINITASDGDMSLSTVNGHAVPKINFASTQFSFTSSTSMVYVGKSVTCPSGARMLVRAYFRYINGGPMEVAAVKSSTAVGGYHSECYAYGGGSGLSTACLTFMLVSGETAYYWAKYANATSNRIDQETITFSNDSTA